jgi:DNA-binding response OmpR family regulator
LEQISLTQAGSNVEVIKEGNKPQERIQRENFDLLILDVMIPGVTGFELAQITRQSMGNGVKIIMVSGILQGTDVSESRIRMKADADAFLNKPFQMKDLVTKVKDLLAD